MASTSAKRAKKWRSKKKEGDEYMVSERNRQKKVYAEKKKPKIAFLYRWRDIERVRVGIFFVDAVSAKFSHLATFSYDRILLNPGTDLKASISEMIEWADLVIVIVQQHSVDRMSQDGDFFAWEVQELYKQKKESAVFCLDTDYGIIQKEVEKVVKSKSCTTELAKALEQLTMSRTVNIVDSETYEIELGILFEKMGKGVRKRKRSSSTPRSSPLGKDSPSFPVNQTTEACL
jgi:predicted protein tyrosine phosphatase